MLTSIPVIGANCLFAIPGFCNSFLNICFNSGLVTYPGIKTNIDNLSDYDVVLIVAPQWWNNMAAPLQTFLFRYGTEMADKSVGLVVSSGESSIEGVEADVKRLVPKAKYLEPSL